MARLRPRRKPDVKAELAKAQTRFDSLADQARQSVDGFRDGFGLPKPTTPATAPTADPAADTSTAAPDDSDAEFLTVLS